MEIGNVKGQKPKRKARENRTVCRDTHTHTHAQLIDPSKSHKC